MKVSVWLGSGEAASSKIICCICSDVSCGVGGVANVVA